MSDYAIGTDVAWLERPGAEVVTVVVSRLPDGPPVSLVGSSAAIWLAALDGGDEEAVRDRVAAMTGDDPLAIDTDVRAFLAELVARGLLSAG